MRDLSDVAKEERNTQGQLAKGRLHVTPRFVDVDENTLPNGVAQYVLSFCPCFVEAHSCQASHTAQFG